MTAIVFSGYGDECLRTGDKRLTTDSNARTRGPEDVDIVACASCWQLDTDTQESERTGLS